MNALLLLIPYFAAQDFEGRLWSRRVSLNSEKLALETLLLEISYLK